MSVILATVTHILSIQANKDVHCDLARDVLAHTLSLIITLFLSISLPHILSGSSSTLHITRFSYLLCYKTFSHEAVTVFDGDKVIHLFDTVLVCLRRTQSGRRRTGNTILMKRGIPRSWTRRLRRWTRHETNVQSQTPKRDTNIYVENTTSPANNTVVTASEKGTTKEDSHAFGYINNAGEQLFVTPNCTGIDTNDATEKRFGTIERKMDKETPNERTAEQGNEDILGRASVIPEPVETSADSTPIESEQLDDRNTYVSVKKYRHIFEEIEQQENEDRCSSYISFDGESVNIYSSQDGHTTLKRPAESGMYTSVKKHSPNTNMRGAGADSSIETCEPPYADKETVIELTLREDTEQHGVDMTSGSLLRVKAGRHHSSMDETSQDGGGKVTKLHTWPVLPEKVDVVNDRTTERSCKTFVSATDNKDHKSPAPHDRPTYISVFPDKLNT